MTDHFKAPVPADAELRTLWQQAGGIFFSSSREAGSMPLTKLFPFLRRLMGPDAVVIHAPPEVIEKIIEAGKAAPPPQLAPAPPAAIPDSVYASALIKLVGAACPGLDAGNLLEDARRVTESFERTELVGYFGIDDEPLSDGSARYLQVGNEHHADEDVFPLYRRAAAKSETAATPAARATGKKAAASKDGAS